uniref:SNF2 N-terminal domain-containing protein n=1 Tax=Moniliophthora roreri TaxID=221103 RepID=A0A0W0G4E9_MONRR
MGSLDTSSDLSLPIDTDIDELDVMDMPITLSAPLPKSSPAPRRSTRERKSTGVRYTDSVNKKRKAAPSTVPSHKKAKVEEKKANTEQNNEKRADRDNRRAHWLLRHREVVEPLRTEAARWLPSFSTVRFHGSGNERIRLRKALMDGKYDLLVTTYDVFVAEDSWFKSRCWTYTVLDEGHKVKNSETNVSHKLHSIGAMYGLEMTRNDFDVFGNHSNSSNWNQGSVILDCVFAELDSTSEVASLRWGRSKCRIRRAFLLGYQPRLENNAATTYS